MTGAYLAQLLAAHDTDESEVTELPLSAPGIINAQVGGRRVTSSVCAL